MSTFDKVIALLGTLGVVLVSLAALSGSWATPTDPADAVQITAQPFDVSVLDSVRVSMQNGDEFATPTGEMPDQLARTVAGLWADDSPVLERLANGKSVDRYELVGEIARQAQPEGWPVELEYLTTWALNHD